MTEPTTATAKLRVLTTAATEGGTIYGVSLTKWLLKRVGFRPGDQLELQAAEDDRGKPGIFIRKRRRR